MGRRPPLQASPATTRSRTQPPPPPGPPPNQTPLTTNTKIVAPTDRGYNSAPQNIVRPTPPSQSIVSQKNQTNSQPLRNLPSPQINTPTNHFNVTQPLLHQPISPVSPILTMLKTQIEQQQEQIASLIRTNADLQTQFLKSHDRASSRIQSLHDQNVLLQSSISTFKLNELEYKNTITSMELQIKQNQCIQNNNSFTQEQVNDIKAAYDSKIETSNIKARKIVSDLNATISSLKQDKTDALQELEHVQFLLVETKEELAQNYLNPNSPSNNTPVSSSPDSQVLQNLLQTLITSQQESLAEQRNARIEQQKHREDTAPQEKFPKLDNLNKIRDWYQKILSVLATHHWLPLYNADTSTIAQTGSTHPKLNSHLYKNVLNNVSTQIE